MDPFIEFLESTAMLKVGGRPVFTPGLYDPTSVKTWTTWPNAKPVKPEDFQLPESTLNCELPQDYKRFLQILGPGCFADAYFPSPSHLYAYDEEVGEMCGFIPLAFNVNGCGDDIAFSPRHYENIFFCCHDPFGYATAAISFEQYLREIAEYKLSGIDMRSFYESLTPFTEVSVSIMPSRAKHWWEFWK